MEHKFILLTVILCCFGISASAQSEYPRMIDISAGQSVPEEYPDNLWFHQLGAVQAWPGESLRRTASEVYDLLRDDDRDVEGVFDFLAEDKTEPRIVGLSWSGGAGRGETVFGRGNGWDAATVDAVRRARRRRMDSSDKVENVKLSVVQDVVLFPEWELDEHPIADPGLRGVAFTPESPYAFLPAEIMFNRLYTPEGKLQGVRMTELLVGAVGFQELGEFRRMVDTVEAQPLFSFDKQAVFFDGENAERIYRGHPLLTNVDYDKALESLARGIDFLRRRQSREGGFPPGGDNWLVHTEHGEPSLFSQVLILQAFLDYFNLSGEQRVLTAAERHAAYLSNYIESVPDSAHAEPLVEFTMADTDTNALAVSAWLDLSEATGEEKYLLQALKMAHFLRLQSQPAGAIMARRYLPQNHIDTRISVRSAALAIVAFVRMYEYTDDTWFIRTAEESMEYLMREYLTDAGMSELADFPEIAHAANALYSYTRDERLVRTVKRLVLSLEARQRRRDLPVADFLGSYPERITALDVAGLTPSLIEAADLLIDGGRRGVGETALETAHFGLIYHLQGQIEEAAAMYLQNSEEYLGGFRDDIREMRLSIKGQSRQLWALSSLVRLMEKNAITSLSLSAEGEEVLEHRDDLFFEFGRGLPLEIRRRRR